MQFIRDAWNTWGEFPLWNPLILSGAPLIGDPLFGIWYPPNWLALLLPVQIAFNILFWIHLAWAGIGMFQWMKSENVGWGGALIAGIAFSGTPKLIGHIGLGHLGFVSAVAWTPWLLLITRRIVVSFTSQEKRSIHWISLGGAVASILFLADPRWILPAAGLAFLYAIRIFKKDGMGKGFLSFKNAGVVLVGLMIFLGLVSGLALPLIEFTARSTRTNLSFEEITDISLPINSLLGILIPNYGGWAETTVFLGFIVIGLAIIAVLGKGKGWLFWFSVAIGSLLLAFGDQTPLYKILFNIVPGFRFFRVPARFFFISSFSAAVLAGIGFNVLINGSIPIPQAKRIRLGLVGFSGLLFLGSIGVLIILTASENSVEFPWQHMILGAILYVGLGFFSLQGKIPEKVQVALWCIALVLDLFLMNQSLLEIRSKQNLFIERAKISNGLPQISRLERNFSPSYSIPQNVAEMEDLQLADGVNPLQQRTYWEFMAEALGFDRDRYSVTNPPFPEGDLTLPWYTSPDTYALGLLNVGTIISAYPINSAGVKEISEIDGVYFYRNVEVRPRAWIEADSEGEEHDWRDVESIEWSPNLISIETQGYGQLVLSELSYPGWVATIDGKEVEITPYEGILRSVLLEGGASIVEFNYHPWTVFVGLRITLFTLIILAIIWWRR